MALNSALDYSDSPNKFDLGNSDIDVWRASLDCDDSLYTEYEATLSEDERMRASRFHFELDRNHFVAGRGILRTLLAAYQNTQPGQLEFDYGRHGKPCLRLQTADLLSFNLSHSGATAIYSFGRNRDLGVDIEVIRPDFAGEEIAERFFSAHELEDLRGLDPKLRDEGFFLCWTRKEAYVKACGEGMQVPLDSFDVTLAPGAVAAFLRGVSSAWRIVDLSIHPSVAAALVYNGLPASLNFRTIAPRL